MTSRYHTTTLPNSTLGIVCQWVMDSGRPHIEAIVTVDGNCQVDDFLEHYGILQEVSADIENQIAQSLIP